jgi:hypothetical protein
MSSRFASIVVLCFAALGSPAAPQPSPGTDAVLARERQRVEYLTSGKLDQLAEILSPTLTYTHSSAVLDSKDQFLETLRSGAIVYKSLAHRNVVARLVAPDVAILNGESDVVVSRAGKEETVPLRFTMVYVRRNGQWQMEVWQSTRRPA